MRQAEFAELSREVMPVLDKLTEIAGQHGTAEKLVSITLSAEGYKAQWESENHKPYTWDDLDGKRPTMEEFEKENE